MFRELLDHRSELAEDDEAGDDNVVELEGDVVVTDVGAGKRGAGDDAGEAVGGRRGPALANGLPQEGDDAVTGLQRFPVARAGEVDRQGGEAAGDVAVVAA